MLPVLDRRPRYLQAADALAALLDNDYPTGALLPPADQLAQRIGVSRSTLREAMSYLERDGRLVRKQGRGTFVAKGTTGLLVNRLEQVSGLRNLAHAARVAFDIVEHEVVRDKPMPEWAQAMCAGAAGANTTGADTMGSYVYIHTVIAIAGVRAAYFEDMVGPDPVGVNVLIEKRITALEYLCTRDGPPAMYTDSHIIAAVADENVAMRLCIRVGDPVLKMQEVFYSDDGRPLAYQQAYLLTDYIDYRLVRRVAWRPHALAES